MDRSSGSCWKKYFLKDLDQTKYVVSMNKANGEAAHMSCQWRNYHRTKGAVSPQIFEKKYSEKSFSLASNYHKPIRMLLRLLFFSILFL